MAIRFGAEICGDLAAAERREWLISNGLGSYGSGSVAGTRTRSYHGLLVAALGAPADPCSRTLLVAGLEELARCDGRLQPWGHGAIVAFSLEGSVPTWRYAIGEALLEKRLWMQPGAHTSSVHYRLLQASRPLQLELGVLVNARCHHGGSERPPLPVRVLPRGLAVDAAAAGAAPFVVLSDRGTTRLAPAHDWVCGPPLAAERERGLPDRDDQLRAGWITAELSG